MIFFHTILAISVDFYVFSASKPAKTIPTFSSFRLKVKKTSNVVGMFSLKAETHDATRRRDGLLQQIASCGV